MKSLRAFLFLLFFMGMWIVPLIYLGVSGRYAPWVPLPVQNVQNTFQLFVSRIRWWPVMYLQARFDGATWVTLPEDEYFKMRPFGYRSRLTRYREIFSSPGLLAHDELAWWVRRRYRQLHPDGPDMTAFRLIVGQWTVREKGFTPTWVKPSFEDFSDRERYVLSATEFS